MRFGIRLNFPRPWYSKESKHEKIIISHGLLNNRSRIKCFFSCKIISFFRNFNCVGRNTFLKRFIASGRFVIEIYDHFSREEFLLTLIMALLNNTALVLFYYLHMEKVNFIIQIRMYSFIFPRRMLTWWLKLDVFIHSFNRSVCGN